MREETVRLPVFAHVFGQSLGMAKTESDLPALVARLGEAPLRLHVFPRVLPENGFSKEEWARIDERRTGIARTLEQAGLALAPGERAQDGEAVVDVILGDPGEALFVGWHRHDARRRPFPGGMPRASLPDGAPSRAWLKMEQALVCLGLDEPASLRGRCAVELGSAPGGGSLALLGQVRRFSPAEPRATQLPSNRREITVLAHAPR